MNNRRSFLLNTALGSLAYAASKASKGISNTSVVECDKTTLDYYGQGPFYKVDSPLIQDNKLVSTSEDGTKIVISGRVLNLECNQYIPNTIVDVWHADHAGDYDNQGYNFRGHVLTNTQGFYLFETIQPGKYLNGNRFRPSHIHFKVTPPNFPSLITQLYFEGDTDIPEDAAASITEGTYDASNRIITLSENSDGVLEGSFDIVIDGNGVSVGISDIHLETGMVYNTQPNPFTSEIEIKYGVFKKSKVGLVVYNIQGEQVAILEDEVKTPEKYTATWRPHNNLSPGHYFIALRINDLQVHYLKVLKA